MTKIFILLSIALPFLEGCTKQKKYLKDLPGLTADMTRREMAQTMGDTTNLRGNIANRDNAIREKEERKKKYPMLPLQKNCEVGSLNHLIQHMQETPYV